MQRLLQLPLLCVLLAAQPVVVAWGESEGQLALLDDSAGNNDCVPVPGLNSPLGDKLGHLASGTIFCAVNGSGQSQLPPTVIAFDPVRCGVSDSGIRAKWFGPYIWPERQTRLINVKEINVQIADQATGRLKWAWSGAPGQPFSAPDFVLGDYLTMEKLLPDGYSSSRQRQAALHGRALVLPAKYANHRRAWTNGMFFPTNARPHGYVQGQLPFVMCMCDETWYCSGHTAPDSSCDVVLDMVREPWCADCLAQEKGMVPSSVLPPHPPQLNHGFTGVPSIWTPEGAMTMPMRNLHSIADLQAPSAKAESAHDARQL